MINFVHLHKYNQLRQNTSENVLVKKIQVQEYYHAIKLTMRRKKSIRIKTKKNKK